jgi:hypothetical protein
MNPGRWDNLRFKLDLRWNRSRRHHLCEARLEARGCTVYF